MTETMRLLGVSRGKRYVRFQVGGLRLYVSLIPLKPKYESKLRRGVRRLVWDRAGRRCEVCGCELPDLGALSLHHVRPRSEAPELTNDPDNCMAVCHRCHRTLHQRNQVEKSLKG